MSLLTEEDTESNTTTIQTTFSKNTKVTGVMAYKDSTRPISGDYKTWKRSINASHRMSILAGQFEASFRYLLTDTDQERVDEDLSRIFTEHHKSQKRYEVSYAKRLSRFAYTDLRYIRVEEEDGAGAEIEESFTDRDEFTGNLYYRMRSWFLGARYSRSVEEFSHVDGQEIETRMMFTAHRSFARML